MTNRCTSIMRVAAFLVLALALWGMPAALRAQADGPCACDHYTITVDPALACRVALCYQLSPDGPSICTILSPGAVTRIPCPVYQASLQLCNGSIVIIGNPVIARCTQVFHIERDCCARACRSADPAGCPLIQILAAPCANDVCP